MCKVVLLLACIITILEVTYGNIFTDPNKLSRLFKFQLRLSKIIHSMSDEELVNIPQEVLVGILR